MSILNISKELEEQEKQALKDIEELDSYTIYDVASDTREDLTFNKQGDVQRKLWVVFYDPPTNQWWNKHLHQGYHHCMTIQWDGFMWILSNHTIGHTEIFTLPVEKWEDVKKFIEYWFEGENFSYVNVTTVLNSDKPRRTKLLFTPYTCTELVKATLGVREYFLWTPYQLYKHFVSQDMIVEEHKEE